MALQFETSKERRYGVLTGQCVYERKGGHRITTQTVRSFKRVGPSGPVPSHPKQCPMSVNSASSSIWLLGDWA